MGDLKKPAVIFDIDSTLADNTHRQHFIAGKEKRCWRSFYESMTEDKPLPMAIRILRTLEIDYTVFLVTGRPFEFYSITADWLWKHDVPFDFLLMRPTGDYRQDVEVKLELYEKNIAPNFDVKLVLEDRTQVVKMWRSVGLETWQVCEGEY